MTRLITACYYGRFTTIQKLDFSFPNIVEIMLRNRMFYVSLHGKQTRERYQTNGLLQGSVLAAMLFDIYTSQLGRKRAILYVRIIRKTFDDIECN